METSQRYYYFQILFEKAQTNVVEIDFSSESNQVFCTAIMEKWLRNYIMLMQQRMLKSPLAAERFFSAANIEIINKKTKIILKRKTSLHKKIIKNYYLKQLSF